MLTVLTITLASVIVVTGGLGLSSFLVFNR